MKGAVGSVFHGAALNVLTQIAVSVLALISIPVLVARLGGEMFGLLTLIWLVVGYFSVLDLGVGVAGVKALAEQLDSGDTVSARRSVIAGLSIAIGLGAFMSLLFFGLSPWLVRLLGLEAHGTEAMARSALMIAGTALPAVMLQNTLRSVPVALKRFDLVNLVQGVSGVVQWGGAVVLVVAGRGIVEVILLTVVVRYAGVIGLYVAARRVFPPLSLRWETGIAPQMRSLLAFGGWVTVSQLVNPLVRYLDRVFVVAYQSLRVFTFYAVPYEALVRLQVLPHGLSTALFPVLVERASGDRAPFTVLFHDAVRATLLVMLPLTIVLVAFSQDILRIWLGGEFPVVSNWSFKILAVCVSLHALAYLPVTALQAVGRPNAVAMFYLIEIPAYVLLCVLLIPWLGIEGAALCWLIRLVLLTVGLTWALRRHLNTVWVPGTVRILLVNLLLAAALATVQARGGDLLLRGVVACVGLGGYALAVWSMCLGERERTGIIRLLRRGAVSVD